MLLIYSPQITNRLRYTCNLIFHDILEIGFEVISDLERFKTYSFEKINYSSTEIGNEFFIQNKPLLFETSITNQDIQVTNWEDIPVFFQTSEKSSIPFDLFAATFFMVSRYEEYLPHIRDKHDRFSAEQSIAFANGFLQKPIVNIWVEKLKQKLLEYYPTIKFAKKKYQYISTIDIDNAYAYKLKGVMRTIGSFSKDLLKLDFKQITERAKVLAGVLKDPYDTYQLQFNIQKKYKIKPIYFILLGDYAENDKNVPFENQKFRALIKHISDYADVGIHPSYGSNGNKKQLKKEVKRLSFILNREITKSRQHFLKLKLPETYRNLLELDIADDYSMGYASQIGFRAGICTSFNFYDIDQEIETPLKIHPFAVMEATLKYYMKVDPEDVIEQIKPLIDDVKKINGTFISLWHNETLSNDKIWNGWQNLYEDVVKCALA